MFLRRRLHRIWVGEQLSGVFCEGVFDLIFFFLFGFLSLESNLLTSTDFSKTRVSPWWSPTSSGPVVSSHDRAGFSPSAHGLHAPGSSFLGPARVVHDLSSRERLGVFRWIQGLPEDFCCGGGLWWHMRSRLS
jgi:hypothetical protein